MAKLPIKKFQTNWFLLHQYSKLINLGPVWPHYMFCWLSLVIFKSQSSLFISASQGGCLNYQKLIRPYYSTHNPNIFSASVRKAILKQTAMGWISDSGGFDKLPHKYSIVGGIWLPWIFFCFWIMAFQNNETAHTWKK